MLQADLMQMPVGKEQETAHDNAGAKDSSKKNASRTEITSNKRPSR
jgi:hypothetical protein